jgi:hypothetical protein
MHVHFRRVDREMRERSAFVGPDGEAAKMPIHRALHGAG